eukprot:6481758-Amphidinium_carterae.1
MVYWPSNLADACSRPLKTFIPEVCDSAGGTAGEALLSSELLSGRPAGVSRDGHQEGAGC